MSSPLQLRLVLRKHGVLVHEQEVVASACIEDAYFRAVIAGDLANDGRRPPVTLTPRWLPQGEPELAALVVSLAGVDEQFVYASEVFTDLASTAIARLILDKSIEDRGDLVWTIEARRCAEPTSPARFAARVLHRPYPLVAGHLAEQERGTMTVRIEAQVIEKGRAEVLNNPEVEVAGLLLGQVVHDADQGIAEVVARDYAPLAAGERGSSRAHFAFGPKTFAEARAALAESHSSEAAGLTSVGWLHTHPPCQQCFAKSECPAQTVFFSQDDVRVHASAFAAPFNLALVWGKLAKSPASKPGFRIYCWFRGRVIGVDHQSIDAERPALERSGASRVAAATT